MLKKNDAELKWATEAVREKKNTKKGQFTIY